MPFGKTPLGRRLDTEYSEKGRRVTKNTIGLYTLAGRRDFDRRYSVLLLPVASYIRAVCLSHEQNSTIRKASKHLTRLLARVSDWVGAGKFMGIILIPAKSLPPVANSVPHLLQRQQPQRGSV